MDINFELYKVFYEVANQKSISKGAEKLMISQPAVTQSIHTLEDQLGGKLFVRTPKGVVLTNEGLELYNYIKEGMSYFINGTNKFMALKELETGVLNIGASTTISENYLMPYLSKLHEMYPSVIINIENDLTVFLNNLRMNPILFYDSFIKDDNLNKTWTKDFLEIMGKNNDYHGTKPFSVNNDLYELISDYIKIQYDVIKKKLTKKNSIEYTKELQESLEIYLKDKIAEDLITNCKIIKKSPIQHICMQYLYDKDFKQKIFNNEFNSIAVHVNEDLFDDFNLIILAITKVENNDDNEKDRKSVV